MGKRNTVPKVALLVDFLKVIQRQGEGAIGCTVPYVLPIVHPYVGIAHNNWIPLSGCGRCVLCALPNMSYSSEEGSVLHHESYLPQKQQRLLLALSLVR